MARGKDHSRRAGLSRRPAPGTAIALGCLLAGGLAGCASDPDDFVPPAGQAVNEVCRSVANDRANDSGAEGMDDRTQRQVFDLIYADCTAWHAREDANAPVAPIN